MTAFYACQMNNCLGKLLKRLSLSMDFIGLCVKWLEIIFLSTCQIQNHKKTIGLLCVYCEIVSRLQYCLSNSFLAWLNQISVLIRVMWTKWNWEEIESDRRRSHLYTIHRLPRFTGRKGKRLAMCQCYESHVKLKGKPDCQTRRIYGLVRRRHIYCKMTATNANRKMDGKYTGLKRWMKYVYTSAYI